MCFMIIWTPEGLKNEFIYKREFSTRSEAQRYSFFLGGTNHQIVSVKKAR